MTAIALVERASFQRTVAATAALWADVALRPAPLEQGGATLLFRALISHKFDETIAFLKLDFVFHHRVLAQTIYFKSSCLAAG